MISKLYRNRQNSLPEKSVNTFSKNTTRDVPQLRSNLKKNLIATVKIHRFRQMRNSFFRNTSSPMALGKMIEHISSQSSTVMRAKGGRNIRLDADAARVILHSMPAKLVREFIARMYNVSMKPSQRVIHPSDEYKVKIVAVNNRFRAPSRVSYQSRLLASPAA